MAGFATRFLAFAVTVHVLLFFAGDAGMITTQDGENPHLKVIDTFEGNSSQLTQSAQVGDSSGIIEQTFSPVLAISDLINSIVGILASPYTTLNASPLPGMLQVLFGSLFGLFEIIAAYSFVRGGAP